MGEMQTDVRTDGRTELQLKDMLNHLDRIIVLAEKNTSQDALLATDNIEGDTQKDNSEERRRRKFISKFQANLIDKDLPNERLQTVIKLYQYHLLEGLYQTKIDDIGRQSGGSDRVNGDRTRACDPRHNNRKDLKPEDIERSQSRFPVIQGKGVDTHDVEEPLRPTELLNRVIGLHKMKRDIVIPGAEAYSASDGSKSAMSKTTSDARQLTRKVPHLSYSTGEGIARNLPTQPDLIRLLTDPEIVFDKTPSHIRDQENNSIVDTGKVFAMHRDTLSPPLVDKTKAKVRRRRIVCKVCKQSPGDHLKWCVYYNFGNDGDRTIFDEDLTNDENSTVLAPSPVSVEPELTRSVSDITKKTTRKTCGPPKYASLHRDVYIRALADSRARLVMRNKLDFLNQTTKPWVFTYFPGTKDRHQSKERKQAVGMGGIFGKKHTDFTNYYDLFVNGRKIQAAKK